MPDLAFDYRAMSVRILEGHVVTRDEALTLLNAPDHDLLQLLDGAWHLRRRHWGHGVRLHVIQNAKCGMCSENCAFCSQSSRSSSEIPRYLLKSVDEIVQGAREAVALQAFRYCIVTSARHPLEKDLDALCQAVRLIKSEFPMLQVCCSLGMMGEAQIKRLVVAGVNRCNHNLETSQRFFPSICQSHTYEDRVATIRLARSLGLEVCSGGLIGMGEAAVDQVDLALALRDLDVQSIPVNFLDPRPGTPLEHQQRLRPLDCLKTLAMFRYVHPDREIRAAGGRETNLRHMQPLALYAANSIFTRGYLTTGGQGYEADSAMIRDAGFIVDGHEA